MGWFSKGPDGKPFDPGATPESAAGASPADNPRASLAGLLSGVASEPRSAPAAEPEVEKVSVFSESVDIEGSLEGQGDVLLKGKVRGSIAIDGALIIAPTGSVQADVLAREVINAGTVEGNIRATEKVRVQATGVVQGDIEAPSVVIDDGGGVEGYVQMAAPGDEVEPAQPVAASPLRAAPAAAPAPATPQALVPNDPLAVFFEDEEPGSSGTTPPAGGLDPFHEGDELRRTVQVPGGHPASPFS